MDLQAILRLTRHLTRQADRVTPVDSKSVHARIQCHSRGPAIRGPTSISNARLARSRLPTGQTFRLAHSASFVSDTTIPNCSERVVHKIGWHRTEVPTQS